MFEPTMSLTDAIWQAIQRPSPAVTRDEIEALVVEWTEAPVADETPNPKRFGRFRSGDKVINITMPDSQDIFVLQDMRSYDDFVLCHMRREHGDKDEFFPPVWFPYSDLRIARFAMPRHEPVYNADGNLHPMLIPAGTTVTSEMVSDIVSAQAIDSFKILTGPQSKRTNPNG
jgi:hypothetical protein